MLGQVPGERISFRPIPLRHRKHGPARFVRGVREPSLRRLTAVAHSIRVNNVGGIVVGFHRK